MCGVPLNSGLIQIPPPVLLSYLAHELAIFGAFDRQVDTQELITESFPSPGRSFKGPQGSEPGSGQQFARLGIAIALHRRAGITLLTDATVDAGQYRRSGQVGVGVSPTNAMFNVPRERRATRYPQAHGAIVHAPDRKSTRLNSSH